jgi:hypothetical protein
VPSSSRLLKLRRPFEPVKGLCTKSPHFVPIDQDSHQSRPRLLQGHVIHAHLTYGNTGEHTEVNSHKPFPKTWGLRPTNNNTAATLHRKQAAAFPEGWWDLVARVERANWAGANSQAALSCFVHVVMTNIPSEGSGRLGGVLDLVSS